VIRGKEEQKQKKHKESRHVWTQTVRLNFNTWANYNLYFEHTESRFHPVIGHEGP